MLLIPSVRPVFPARDSNVREIRHSQLTDVITAMMHSGNPDVCYTSDLFSMRVNMYKQPLGQRCPAYYTVIGHFRTGCSPSVLDESIYGSKDSIEAALAQRWSILGYGLELQAQNTINYGCREEGLTCVIEDNNPRKIINGPVISVSADSSGNDCVHAIRLMLRGTEDPTHKRVFAAIVPQLLVNANEKYELEMS